MTRFLDWIFRDRTQDAEVLTIGWEHQFPEAPDTTQWPDICSDPPCKVWFDNLADRSEWRHCDRHAPRGRHAVPQPEYGAPPIVANVTSLADRGRPYREQP